MRVVVRLVVCVALRILPTDSRASTRSGFAAAALPSGPLSRVHRLQLDGDGASADVPATLVLKTAPPRGEGADDGARLLAAANRSFEREVGFLKAMATEKPPLPSAPFAFFAACDKASGRAAVLMEDCEAHGAVRADAPVLGGDADAPHALCADAAPALVRALAAQHARFWGGGPFALWRWLPEVNGARLRACCAMRSAACIVTNMSYRLPRPCLLASIVREFEPALCAAALPEALARFGDVVPAQLRPSLSGLAAAAAGPILARLASAPRTLLHGSAVAANAFAPRGVLAGAEEGAAAAATVRFVDDADVAAGRGVLDVARLLASAMHPDDRRARGRKKIRFAFALLSTMA